MVVERLSWRVTWPNHETFRLLTVDRRGSCGPTRKLSFPSCFHLNFPLTTQHPPHFPRPLLLEFELGPRQGVPLYCKVKTNTYGPVAHLSQPVLICSLLH